MKKFNKFILNPIFSNDLRYNFYFLNRIEYKLIRRSIFMCWQNCLSIASFLSVQKNVVDQPQVVGFAAMSNPTKIKEKIQYKIGKTVIKQNNLILNLIRKQNTIQNLLDINLFNGEQYKNIFYKVELIKNNKY